MSLRTRVFIGLLLIFAAGVSWMVYRMALDIDPRYRESAEESLVETAHLMAAQIEQRWVERAATPAEPVIDVAVTGRNG